MTTMAFRTAALAHAPASPEDELVQRLAAGERMAVAEAYDLHHEAVRRFARRLVGDDATAEDLVHETFVRLPALAARFRGDSSLRSFLIAVAVNHARHHVRAAARLRRTTERAGTEWQHLATPVEGPDRALERERLARILTRALDELSLDHRVAFVLSEVEGRTSREIATIVDVPEGTVRTRLMHAKKKLRGFLEKEGLP